MSAYYNENDPKTAAWLRELIKAGLIADGEVDTRSIVDVRPADLAGFVQCHFFAGIGGWSYALRLAHWDDARPVWSGSCPCQPFSSAGAQTGGNDPRDLWPAWYQLVKECRPSVVFGEQVESAIRHGWLDRVCDDLEAEDYAVGAVGLPATCAGAFHIRPRLWFVGALDESERERTERIARGQGRAERQASRDGEDERRGLLQVIHAGADAGDVAESACTGLQRRWHGPSGSRGARPSDQSARTGDTGLMADTYERESSNEGLPRGWRLLQPAEDAPPGFWSAAEWLPCRDSKARPVEPGTFPLAHGLPARVGRLRGYGNAIVPQVAAEVIAAYMEITT